MRSKGSFVPSCLRHSSSGTARAQNSVRSATQRSEAKQSQGQSSQLGKQKCRDEGTRTASRAVPVQQFEALLAARVAGAVGGRAVPDGAAAAGRHAARQTALERKKCTRDRRCDTTGEEGALVGRQSGTQHGHTSTRSPSAANTPIRKLRCVIHTFSRPVGHGKSMMVTVLFTCVPGSLPAPQHHQANGQH